MRGLNVTIWEPYEASRGQVVGIALGLPLTGAHRLTGIGARVGLSVVARNKDSFSVLPLFNYHP